VNAAGLSAKRIAKVIHILNPGKGMKKYIIVSRKNGWRFIKRNLSKLKLLFKHIDQREIP
jgi:hypothetical protein